jgi:hypothetical protein
VNAVVEVRQTEGVEPAPLGPAKAAGAPGVDLGDVSRLLAGSLAIWTLRISQRLLNTTIQAALDTASTAMSETETGPTVTQNARWPLNLKRVIRSLQVQLEAGTLVVTGDAQLPDDVRGAGL